MKTFLEAIQKPEVRKISKLFDKKKFPFLAFSRKRPCCPWTRSWFNDSFQHVYVKVSKNRQSNQLKKLVPWKFILHVYDIQKNIY